MKQEALRGNTTDEVEQEDFTNRPRKPFSLDELKMYWRQLAYQMKSQGNEALFVGLNKRDPKVLDQFQIVQEVDHQVMLDMLAAEKQEILSFLRSKLQNWGVTVEFVISQSQDESTKMLTGKDKFEALARKNANLFTLQKVFNLDIEY